MQNQSPVKQARKVSDFIVLLITMFIVLIAAVFVAENFIILFYTMLGILLFSLFYVRVFQISYLANALRVQNGRHAYLKNITEEISQNLQMPYVDVFISQNPYLNAFAVGYMRPYTIVLHSAIVEELTQEELRVILIHEMAHIKYHHTFIKAYVLPMGTVVPIVGPIVAWTFNFWGRRAELAADRLAVSYSRDPHTVMSALIKISVGSKFGEYMGEEGVLYQEKITHGPMKLIAQTLSSHPYLVTRVHEIRQFSSKIGLNI